MLVIGIETSGHTASCALCTEKSVLAQISLETKRTHSQLILPMVKEMLGASGHTLDEADGFAAASGPGSYTGLRIGISAVKGICFGLNKKCAGISSLLSLAYNFSGTDSTICSVMKARQKLVYTAMFKTCSDGSVERISEDEIIDESALADKLKAMNGQIICAGDYSRQLTELADSPLITAAQPHLNSPLASSLCFAAMNSGFYEPDQLNPEYMQITKAEKELCRRIT